MSAIFAYKELYPMFKTKLFIAAIAMAIICIGYTGHTASVAKSQLVLAQAQVEKLEAQLSERQAEVDNLAVSVKRADEFLTQLRQERALLDKLHSEQLSERAKLQAELANAKAAVNNLRQSHDQFVKAWADTRMPNDAVRLLKYAQHPGNYPNGGATSAGVSDTAGKFTNRLST
jgi:septal ring factor EnvC (AmiA/AmiB activator)